MFKYNDGGRTAAGFKGHAGDCVCRSIAIATGLPYKQVYKRLADGNATRGTKYSCFGPRSARNGINTQSKWFKDYMNELGFTWYPTMRIGSGCTVHLHKDEIPAGRIIVALSRHYAAVIHGEINDTHDCSRNGTRCVYGYWILED